MLAPKLRFKEFNDEWKKVKINKILKIKHGKNQKEIECINGKYPILGTGGIIGTTNTPAYLKESVLIGRKGTIDKPMYINIPFWTVDTLFYSDVSSKYNVKFIYYLFNTINWKKYDESTGVPSLSANTIENIDVNISLEKVEQLKISQFLSLVDKKIELQQRKIEVLKMYKKGLLLNEFSNKDKNISLEKILKIGKAGGTPKSTNRDYYNGDIPFLSISDMTNQGKYITKTEKKISKSGLENSSAWILPENTLILSMYASYGVVALNKIKLATSQAMFNMILKDNINIEYIYYYLNYLRETHYYDSIVSQGTQPNLNADKVRRMLIYLPSLEEQCKVSKIFINIDKKIDIENKKMEEILKLKNGLLQNMFI